MNLREWAIIFLKHKDALKKEIEKITPTDEGLLLVHKNGSVKKVLVQDSLDARKTAADIIVCLNTKNNVQMVVDNWESYCTQQALLLIFARPSSHRQWLLKPALHDRITEKKHLKQGLLTLGEEVGFT